MHWSKWNSSGIFIEIFYFNSFDDSNFSRNMRDRLILTWIGKPIYADIVDICRYLLILTDICRYFVCLLSQAQCWVSILSSQRVERHSIARPFRSASEVTDQGTQSYFGTGLSEFPITVSAGPASPSHCLDRCTSMYSTLRQIDPENNQAPAVPVSTDTGNPKHPHQPESRRTLLIPT